MSRTYFNVFHEGQLIGFGVYAHVSDTWHPEIFKDRAEFRDNTRNGPWDCKCDPKPTTKVQIVEDSLAGRFLDKFDPYRGEMPACLKCRVFTGDLGPDDGY